ncbi:CLC_0170 family protein [Cohnella laeviribosi]
MSGLAILYFDVKRYKMLGMKKEKKVALILAYFNITITVLMFIVQLVYPN